VYSGVNRGDTPESGWIHLKVGTQCVLFPVGLFIRIHVPQAYFLWCLIQIVMKKVKSKLFFNFSVVYIGVG